MFSQVVTGVQISERIVKVNLTSDSFRHCTAFNDFSKPSKKVFQILSQALRAGRNHNVICPNYNKNSYRKNVPTKNAQMVPVAHS